MRTRRHAHPLIAGVISLIATLAIGVASVAAHMQTVNPRGAGDPGITLDPISQQWAQAHCHAQAPAVVFNASGGVVVFNPARALPCPQTVTNPGGQVTGP